MAASCPSAVDTADELLTQQQTAKLLKVTVPTVRAMIDRAELRAFRVGPRAVRIRHSDLDSILRPIESDTATCATTLDAKRDSRAAQLVEQYIEKVLSQAPPLSDEQRNRLAELLRPARQGGGDHAA